MSRCMAQPCPLSLSFLLPHEVVRGLGLFLEFMFEVGRRGGVDDAAESGTAVPAPSLLAACTCCCVLVHVGPFGVHAWKTVTGSSCVVPRCLAQPCPLPPLLAACTRWGALRLGCWIRRYRLLSLVAVLSVRCHSVWHGSARFLAASCGHTLLLVDYTRGCVMWSRADTAVSAPFWSLFERTVPLCLVRQRLLSHSE